MKVELTESERQHLRQLQKQRCDEAGYVKVTVVLLLDKRRPLASIADDRGLDESTVYRYARAFQALGVEKYLAHEQPGYWGLPTSAQLAPLCQEINATFYMDAKALQAWLLRTYRVVYSVSGLTDLLHCLGFTCKLTTPVPCQADAAAQADFLDKLDVLDAHVERGGAVLYYADAAHPTHNTRCTRAWCAVGQERPLLTVSGRERVNLNAAPNAYEPPQVLLDEPLVSTRRAPGGCTSSCWPPTPTQPASTSSATTPVTTKTKNCGPGWPISRFARCFAALFAQPEPDGALLEVSAPEDYQHDFLPHQRPVSHGRPRFLYPAP